MEPQTLKVNHIAWVGGYLTYQRKGFEKDMLFSLIIKKPVHLQN